MSKPPVLQIPSIEVPTTDVRSLQNTVQQLKEAVEIMSGQRGASPFATQDDLKLLQQRAYQLEQAQGWKTLYKYSSMSFNRFDMLNLAGYEMIRGSVRAQMLAVDGVRMLCSDNNGGIFYNTTGNYGEQIAPYSATTGAGAASLAGTGLTTADALNFGGWQAGLLNAAPAFGVQWDFVMTGMHTAYTSFQGPLKYENNGGTVLMGLYHGWIGVNVNAIRIASRGGALMKGSIVLEGLKL